MCMCAYVCVCVCAYGNAKKSTPEAMRATHAQMNGNCFAEHFIAAPPLTVDAPELADVNRVCEGGRREVCK